MSSTVADEADPGLEGPSTGRTEVCCLCCWRGVRQSLFTDLSFFLCILHSIFLKSLCGIVDGAAPGRPLLCFGLPGCWVQMELFQGRLEGVLVSFLLSSMIAFSLHKLTEEEALGESLVWHSCNMASPSELGLL